MSQRLTTTEFITRARERHGGAYSYEKTDYVGALDKVIITCQKHGDFTQQAGNHLFGQRCPSCSKTKKLTPTEFIKSAYEIHGNTYSYEKTDYIGTTGTVIITCQKHGDFTQRANNHLRGNGCPGCKYTNRTSRIANKWLDSLGIAEEYREVALTEFPHRYLDAYDSTTNTVYQFHGDYWHGNSNIYDSDTINAHSGKTMGELYESTVKWDQQIRDLGYNLVAMWESDFRQQIREKDTKMLKNSPKNSC